MPRPAHRATGQHLISYAGLSALSGFLNATDFRDLQEDRFSQFVPTATHRPGKTPADRPLLLAAGGEQARDVDLLCTKHDVFGPVASEATMSLFMNRIKDIPKAFTHGFQTMSRTLRT